MTSHSAKTSYLVLHSSHFCFCLLGIVASSACTCRYIVQFESIGTNNGRNHSKGLFFQSRHGSLAHTIAICPLCSSALLFATIPPHHHHARCQGCRRRCRRCHQGQRFCVHSPRLQRRRSDHPIVSELGPRRQCSPMKISFSQRRARTSPLEKATKYR